MQNLDMRLKNKIPQVLLAFALVVLPLHFAMADDVYEVVVKRVEKKKASGWSLSEWLETKNRIALMDMWLAFHTPSPYEFYLGGNYQFGMRSGSAYNGGQVYFAAFASLFGLEVQRDQSYEKIINGLFHMRLLGFSNQSTNITLHGGMRFEGAEPARSAVAGVSATFYLMKYFGIDGLYRHIFKSQTTTAGYRLYGDRYEAGGFIDFKFLRLYGSYFHEEDQNPIRSGGLAGVRLFF